MKIRSTPLAVLITLLFPSIVYVAFTASSMTLGLIICALGWALLGLATGRDAYVLKRWEIHSLVVILAVIALFACHLAIASVWISGISVSRFALSCGILAMFVISSILGARRLINTPVISLIRSADLALVVLTTLCIAATLGVPAIGPNATAKPVVFFAEPSHLSLAYIPVLLFRVSVSKWQTQLFLIGSALSLGLILESLTMVAGTLLVAGLLLRRTALLLMICSASIAALSINLTYYSSRLVFSTDTDNLSALILMQGWETAFLANQETSGTGVGFQQFGVAGPVGELAEKIAGITKGGYLNLRDGGSTASKIVGEFGTLGIAALVAYLGFALRAARFVRESQQRAPPHRNVRLLFFYSLALAYGVELFVRGCGYFTPGGFFTLTAMISLHSLRRLRSENWSREFGYEKDASTADKKAI